jgi:hypothetical protein
MDGLLFILDQSGRELARLTHENSVLQQRVEALERALAAPSPEPPEPMGAPVPCSS